MRLVIDGLITFGDWVCLTAREAVEFRTEKIRPRRNVKALACTSQEQEFVKQQFGFEILFWLKSKRASTLTLRRPS
jgi:type III secretory pathway component EscU